MAPGIVYFPKYADISPEKSAKILRQLELEAYSAIISALRAQGDLSKEKRTLLNEICSCLGVTDERHRAEIRRAVNDEKLATLALRNAGRESEVEWIKEGRRKFRLQERRLPITKYTEKADRIAQMLAAENASISEPRCVDVHKANHSARKPDPPEKPLEIAVQSGLRLHSSLYCVGCLAKQNQLVDAGTSTFDLVEKKKVFDPTNASDDCIHLPSGTVVRVSAKKLENEEADAYSYDSAHSGNYDFSGAPEISLTDSKAGKKKRRKSSGYVPPKEGVVTIRQVIRPQSEENPPKYPKPSKRPFEPPQRRDISSSRPDGRPDVRPSEEGPARSSELMARKKRKSLAQTATSAIQHTPVPPEHLYAVGGGAAPRSQHLAHLTNETATFTHGPSKPDYIVSTEHSPTKRIGMQPGHPPVFSSNFSTALTPATWQMARDGPPEPMPSHPHGFRYSPTKPGYRPQKPGLGSYGRRSPKMQHGRKQRASPYSFSKRAGELDHESQRLAKRPPPKRESGGKYPDDAAGPHKMYRPAFNRNIPAHYQFTDIKSEHQSPGFEGHTAREPPKIPVPHSSTLEELASVSLMTSGLGVVTMVETGLAPVSAIVSRVTSPAPGQVSSAASAKKSVSLPLVVSRIHGEEGGSVQMQKIVHSQPTYEAASSITAARQLSVVTPSSFTATKLKIQGSIGPNAGSSPLTQVRLAVTNPEMGTVTSVPISFTSSLPHVIPASSAHVPRVISTIAGKAPTLLKSSSGNVITVTAKPLAPGKRSSVPTIVSGANIVKPQIVPKTSIIVVHKAAAGSKIGKTVAGNISEGSKVITVTTKNLTASSVDFPKYQSENAEESSSESALGSIQGLVSGLNPAGMVKKATVVGMKPKFITMPIHKKPVVGKTKIIQNIIKPQGKVLIKTAGPSALSQGQLKTIPSAKIVKPAELQAPPGQDIVATALSQSLVSPMVAGDDVAAIIPSDSSTFTKIVTSTPAASTMKAIAASYQKNTSGGQHVQTQIVPAAAFTAQDRPRVVLSASPGQTQQQPVLFTPNQPQIHRSPQGGGPQRLKTSAQSQFNPAKTLLQAPVTKAVVTKQLAGPGVPQPPLMQLKMISQSVMSQSSQPTMLHDDKSCTQFALEDVSEQSKNSDSKVGVTQRNHARVQVEVVLRKEQQNYLEWKWKMNGVARREGAKLSGLSEDRGPQKSATSVSVGDRTTFIYQYHPTSSPSSSASQGVPGDVITLHSVDADPKGDHAAEISKNAPKQTDDAAALIRAPFSLQSDVGEPHADVASNDAYQFQ